MLTERQRDDLVSVALHESGHGWIAFAHGVPRSAIILYAYCDDAGISGKYRLKVRVTDPIARTQIGLAGVCAQAVHHFPDMEPDQVFDRLTSGAWPMTASDAWMASGFDLGDVTACMALVRRQWKRIEITADMLVRHTVDQQLPR